MRVSDVEVVEGDGQTELRATVEGKALRKPFRLWYRFPTDFVGSIDPDNGDPFVAALLIPAMTTGEPIELDRPVSRRLRRSLREIQAIYRCWMPSLAAVRLEAPIRDSEPSPAPGRAGVGQFFSLGADSFYTLFKNLESCPSEDPRIRYLILGHGFDRSRLDDAVFEQTVANARQVADTFGKELVVVATNVRALLSKFAPWGLLGHGAGMASVGLVAQEALRTIYIASSMSYAVMIPWASVPFLDPLWSTERLSFVHDGAELSKVQKLRFISRFPIVRETLRVCNSNRAVNGHYEYNCGTCDKCVRTAIGLHIAGVLDECTTLPPIDPEQVALRPPRHPVTNVAFTQELVAALGCSEQDRAIKAALERWLAQAVPMRAGLDGRIDRLEARVAELEARAAALEAENARLRERAGALRQKLAAERDKAARPRGTSSAA
jgi:hypothetical protein